MSRFSKPMVWTLLVAAAFLVLPEFVLGLDATQEKEFNRISQLDMADLTNEAARLLERQYPDEDWDRYRFPSYVFTSRSVEVGYKIAAKQPQLLGGSGPGAREPGIPCYCFCDAMGHKNLLHCFWKDGKAGGVFDDHAAGCNICYGQAMLAFLWHNIGATDQEIYAATQKRFSHLQRSPGH